MSGAIESDVIEKSTKLLRSAHARAQHVQHLLDDFDVEFCAKSRLVTWSIDELRRHHNEGNCATGRAILARCFFHVVANFLVR